MKTPKEDPQDKAARLRERRLSELEQDQAAQEQAKGLTTDIRAVYGLRALSMFGKPGVPAPTSPGVAPVNPFGPGTSKGNVWGRGQSR